MADSWNLDTLGHQATQIGAIGALCIGIYRYILVPAYTWIKGANKLIVIVTQFEQTMQDLNRNLKAFDDRIKYLEDKNGITFVDEGDDSSFQ